MADTNETPGDWLVLVNHEEQYSLWPAHRPVPDGWRDTGSHDAGGELGARRGRDMTPASLRAALGEA